MADLLYGPGRILDLYSLQKGHAPLTDYHGFLGNREILVDSLSRLIDSGVDVLLPSHGDPISNPAEALALFDERLDKLVRNYAAISAMNHYFPSQFENLRDDPLRMQPGPRLDFPPHVRRVAYTSHALISESGAALVMDCGHDSVVTKLEEWIRDGIIETVEGCWGHPLPRRPRRFAAPHRKPVQVPHLYRAASDGRHRASRPVPHPLHLAQRYASSQGFPARRIVAMARVHAHGASLPRPDALPRGPPRGRPRGQGPLRRRFRRAPQDSTTIPPATAPSCARAADSAGASSSGANTVLTTP